MLPSSLFAAATADDQDNQDIEKAQEILSLTPVQASIASRQKVIAPQQTTDQLAQAEEQLQFQYAIDKIRAQLTVQASRILLREGLLSMNFAADNEITMKVMFARLGYGDCEHLSFQYFYEYVAKFPDQKIAIINVSGKQESEKHVFLLIGDVYLPHFCDFLLVEDFLKRQDKHCIVVDPLMNAVERLDNYRSTLLDTCNAYQANEVHEVICSPNLPVQMRKEQPVVKSVTMKSMEIAKKTLDILIQQMTQTQDIAAVIAEETDPTQRCLKMLRVIDPAWQLAADKTCFTLNSNSLLADDYLYEVKDVLERQGISVEISSYPYELQLKMQPTLENACMEVLKELHIPPYEESIKDQASQARNSCHPRHA